MIRLAFMTDAAHIIGASTPDGDALRGTLLPDALRPVMDGILHSDNVVIGRRTLALYSEPGMARDKFYLLTLDRGFQLPPGMGHITVVHDHMKLVERYRHSEDELTVPGGLAVLKLFTPYASRVDVAMTDELIPGNLVFADWDRGDFDLVSSEKWEGGQTRHLLRKG